MPVFQDKQLVWWFLIIPVSVETCSLAWGKNFSQVWKSSMKSESQGQCTCAQCHRIAPVPVPVYPSPRHSSHALAVFSHPGKAQGPTVLKVTKLWLFVSGGEFAVKGIKFSFCKSQGRRISWGCITCHGWEIKFCAMIQRWRSGKAGCLWVTWKAVCTTKSVRISCFSLENCLIILLLYLVTAAFFSFVSGLYWVNISWVLSRLAVLHGRCHAPCRLGQHFFLQQLPDDAMAVPCNGWKERVPATIYAQSVVQFFCSYLRF